MDVKYCDDVERIQLAHDSVQRRTVVKKAMNLSVA
jgi:hypothetical protein